MITILKRSVSAAFVAALIFSSSPVLAGGDAIYDVTITNLTNSISFTPILVASHRKPVTIFELGSPASEDLRIVAESGNIAPLTATLKENHEVVDVQNSGDGLDGFLAPGASVSVRVSAKRGDRLISIASMMLPTNDGFIALDSVQAPKRGSVTYYSPGYDAGTELNDELCANIPGPTCGGQGESLEDVGEGYVHIHRGIHNIADLNASIYDWRNPVAKITVTRIRKK
jgi:hypothetical protein